MRVRLAVQNPVSLRSDRGIAENVDHTDERVSVRGVGVFSETREHWLLGGGIQKKFGHVTVTNGDCAQKSPS